VRYNHTFREEGWQGAALDDHPAACSLVAGWVQTYNTVRLPSALQYLTPWDYYRGDRAQRLTTRQAKLQQARLRRREAWGRTTLRLVPQPESPLEALTHF
jgi:hypothetical protein